MLNKRILYFGAFAIFVVAAILIIVSVPSRPYLAAGYILLVLGLAMEEI